jgi:integrase
MAFLVDTQELKTGLVIFRRADVKHRNWYCRIKVPRTDRYKTVSLKTADIDAARERAFDHDADVRFRIKHEVPIFNRPFSQIAKDYADLQKERVEAGQIANTAHAVPQLHELHLTTGMLKAALARVIAL